MDPVVILAAIKSWFALVAIVFSILVTVSSFLLKMIASYIKSTKDNVPTYVPSKGLIILMAFLFALSQSSPAAHSILMEAKVKAEASKRVIS